MKYSDASDPADRERANRVAKEIEEKARAMEAHRLAQDLQRRVREQEKK